MVEGGAWRVGIVASAAPGKRDYPAGATIGVSGAGHFLRNNATLFRVCQSAG